MVSSRNPPAGLPPRRNQVLLLPLAIGAVTISIGLAATVRLVRSRGSAVAASPGLSSAPVTQVVALPAPTATFAETADLPPPLSSVELAASIKVPSLAPPVASARSNAKSLGLSKENPFR